MPKRRSLTYRLWRDRPRISAALARLSRVNSSAASMQRFSIRSVVSPTMSFIGTRPTSSVSWLTERGKACRLPPPSDGSRRPTSRIEKPSSGGSDCGTIAAEISTSVLTPNSPRKVVANSLTVPRWRRLDTSTPRSTPVRPSQRSSDWPRICSAPAIWQRLTNSALAASTWPSTSVTTRPSGEAWASCVSRADSAAAGSCGKLLSLRARRTSSRWVWS